MEKKKKLSEKTQEEKRAYWRERYLKERPTRLKKWRQKAKERTLEEKERLKAYQKLWRERNKEYVVSKRRERYEREADYEKTRRQKRYAEHREVILQKAKEKRKQQGSRTYAPRRPPIIPPPPPPPPQISERPKTSLKELINDLFPQLLELF